MALIKFQDWLQMRESSPHTRWRSQWAKGLAADRADVASHSTPSPQEWEKAEKEDKKKKKKKK